MAKEPNDPRENSEMLDTESDTLEQLFRKPIRDALAQVELPPSLADKRALALRLWERVHPPSPASADSGPNEASLPATQTDLGRSEPLPRPTEVPTASKPCFPSRYSDRWSPNSPYRVAASLAGFALFVSLLTGLVLWKSANSGGTRILSQNLVLLQEFSTFEGKEQIRRRGETKVRNGDNYEIVFKVETPRRFGWVVQIDRRKPFRVRELAARSPGLIEGSYRDAFDDTTGLEYFVLILADEDCEALSTRMEGTWLGEQVLKRLQEVDDPAAAQDTIRELLSPELTAAGWVGTREDIILLAGVVHSAR